MSHINDVGGMRGFGPVQFGGDDDEPFHSVWEAQCMMLILAMVDRGVFTLDEFRHAVESLPPQQYLSLPYYERWLTALEGIFDRHCLS
ncbi:SH3-like domain-containing protein [Streptosporangium sp. KLBMP 9127]